MEDEFFDKDEPLYHILYEKMREEEKNHNDRAGCFSIFIILLIHVSVISAIVAKIIKYRNSQNAAMQRE
ncbi:MAG: hypothetical protein SCH71_12730 [Desulfobulbaceae bacterium]|nr:hypothetical protein [Desulfobulbaceae bacterium]